MNRTRLGAGMVVLLTAWQAIGRIGTLDDSDLWWHLATGDWIRDNGIPRSDPFSWTALGMPWQPNAWLSDVLMSLGRDLLGLGVLSIVRALVVPAVALVIYRWCLHRDVGVGAAVATSVTLTLALSPFIVERPAVVGIMAVGLALTVATAPFSPRNAAVLGLLMVGWINLHGSAVAGLGVVGLSVVGVIAADRTSRDRIWYVVAGLVGVLLNPYGWSALTHFFTVRQASATIDEWQPLALDDPRGIAFVLVLAIALGSALNRRQRSDLAIVIPTLALGIGTLMTVRTAALLIVVAAPLIGHAAEAVGRRLAAPRYEGRPHPGVVAAVAAAVVLAVLNLHHLGRIGTVGVAYSTDLAAAIPTDCRLLNEYTLGGWVIDERAPDVLVSQDGRNDMYGAALIESQTDLVLRGGSDDAVAFGATCAYLERRRPLATALDEDSRWLEIAGNDSTAVWRLIP